MTDVYRYSEWISWDGPPDAEWGWARARLECIRRREQFGLVDPSPATGPYAELVSRKLRALGLTDERAAMVQALACYETALARGRADSVDPWLLKQWELCTADIADALRPLEEFAALHRGDGSVGRTPDGHS